MKIDGKRIAEEILKSLKEKARELKKKKITPTLAIILVGDDPASSAYVRQKILKAESIGAKTKRYDLESRIQNSKLIKLIKKLNNDEGVHGIIVQEPLPKHIDVSLITQAIDPAKDVDGFHKKTPFEMPLALAILEILKIISTPIPFIEWLKAKNIVVIGKGETGGGPVIAALRKLSIQPSIVDSKTQNPQLITKNADILISAVGKKNVVRPAMVKKDAILISIGLRQETNGKLYGDYDEEKIKNIASFYTPTPGGVGPVNVACLLKNLITASETAA